jgi:hypothetical protein
MDSGREDVMAGMDFPASPFTGQIYDPGTGTKYIWNGAQWDVYTGTLGTAETRNRVVNPAMQLSQENADTVSPTAAAVSWFVADQWQALHSLSPGTANSSRSGNNLIPGTTDKYMRFNVVTAKAVLAAGDYMTISQPLEGVRVDDFMWGTPEAKQVVLRFMAYSTVAGTYCAALRKGDVSRSYVASFTLAASQWKLVELVIPGDTLSGTWTTGSAVGLYLNISFALGSNNDGVAGWQNGSKMGLPGMTNAAATAGAVCSVGDVGLYRDPEATGKAPPFELPNIGDELLRCMRYWEQINAGDFIFSGNVTAANTYYCGRSFLVPKRAAPVVTLTGANQGNFPAAPGSVASSSTVHVMEGRVASGSGTALFQTTVTANARM